MHYAVHYRQVVVILAYFSEIAGNIHVLYNISSLGDGMPTFYVSFISSATVIFLLSAVSVSAALDDDSCRKMDTGALENRVKVHNVELRGVQGVRESNAKTLGATIDSIRSLAVKKLPPKMPQSAREVIPFLLKTYTPLEIGNSFYDNGDDLKEICEQKLPSISEGSRELALRVGRTFYTATAEQYEFSKTQGSINSQVYEIQKACRKLKERNDEMSLAPNSMRTEMKRWVRSFLSDALPNLKLFLQKIDQRLAKFEENAAICKQALAGRPPVNTAISGVDTSKTIWFGPLKGTASKVQAE